MTDSRPHRHTPTGSHPLLTYSNLVAALDFESSEFSPAHPDADAPASTARFLFADPAPAELIENAVTAPETRYPSRHDGWTSQRMRTFLNVLADCGVVSDAARAAGMSPKSAYALRHRSWAHGFRLAWKAALLRARDRLADELFSRAVNGCVEKFYRDGQLVAERHRPDNRLTLAMLSRLDSEARDLNGEGRCVALVSSEFEDFVDRICEGGEEAAQWMEERADGLPDYVDREPIDRMIDAARPGGGVRRLNPRGRFTFVAFGRFWVRKIAGMLYLRYLR